MNQHDWTNGKHNHLLLANAAAATYDSNYARTAFATGCYMAFEEEALRDAATHALGHRLALDLGCGTGRLSVVLAEQFARVWGCDNSPKMVAEARRTTRSDTRMVFTPFDVEKTHLPFGLNCVDLLNAGFGLFSFVRDSERFIADVHRVLRPGGLFTISCYNADVLTLPPEASWTPALNARVDAQGVCVTHHGETHRINAQAFSPRKVRELLEPMFEVEAMVSLPTLAAVLPDTLIHDARVRRLCAVMDAAVAFREDLAVGAYLWIRARKREKRKEKNRACSMRHVRVRRAHKSPTSQQNT